MFNGKGKRIDVRLDLFAQSPKIKKATYLINDLAKTSPLVKVGLLLFVNFGIFAPKNLVASHIKRIFAAKQQ